MPTDAALNQVLLAAESQQLSSSAQSAAVATVVKISLGRTRPHAKLVRILHHLGCG